MLFRWMFCRDWMNISSIIVWDLWYYIVLEVHWQDSKSNWMNQWYSLHRTPRAHYGILCGVAHGPSTNTVGRQHLRFELRCALDMILRKELQPLRCAWHFLLHDSLGRLILGSSMLVPWWCGEGLGEAIRVFQESARQIPWPHASYICVYKNFLYMESF